MNRKIVVLTAAVLGTMLVGCNAGSSVENESATSKTNDEKTTVSDETTTEQVNASEETSKEIPSETEGLEVDETTEAEVVEPESIDYNTNLISTWGRLYTDGEMAYFVDLSADEKTQIIYSIDASADAVPQKVYEYPSDMLYNIGYISCSFMAGYGDTIVYVDVSRGEESKVYYISKDGSESGEIGTLHGYMDYQGHSQVDDKVYYKTYTLDFTYDEDGDPVFTYYEVDISNKTISEFKPDIKQNEAEAIYHIGITKDKVIYASIEDGVKLCAYDRNTGESNVVGELPSNIYDIMLAGNYVIYTDSDEVISSMNISSGETYILSKNVEFDFEDGCIHAVNDMVYYLQDEKDLYSCTIKGENNKLVARELDGNDKYMLGSFGDWIFFKYNKSSEEYFYRMDKDETEFPSIALCPDEEKIQ